MSEELTEDEEAAPEDESGQDSAQGKKAKKAPKPLPTAPVLLGKLAGATVALPAAAGVFLMAATAGVPLDAAIKRCVVTGVVLWLITSLGIRCLFGFVIRDWRLKRNKQSTGEKMA